MAMVSYTETIRASLDDIQIKLGQVIYCSDTGETFYDSSDGIRVQIGDINYLSTESERQGLIAPITNKLYLVHETNKLWIYDGADWLEMTDTVQIDEAVGDITELAIGTLKIKGQKTAPRTLTTAVYDEYGNRLDKILAGKVGVKEDGDPLVADELVTVDIDGNMISSGYTAKDFAPSTVDVWETSSDLLTPRSNLAGAGNIESALSFGGNNRSNLLATTEKFDGNTWSNSSDMSTARTGLAGCGAQSSALSFGGGNGGSSKLATTEKFDGNTWSSSNNMNTARDGLAGCGTQSSALSFGGGNGGSSKLATTEKFDGNTWSSSNNMNTARDGLAGCGTQDSALAFGGCDENQIAFNNVSIYKNDVWTTGPNLLTRSGFLAGFGTLSDAIACGGVFIGESGSEIVILDSTEKFDGLTWKNINNLSIARFGLASRGGLAYGGTDTDMIYGTTEKLANNDITNIIYDLSNNGLQAIAFYGSPLDMIDRATEN